MKGKTVWRTVGALFVLALLAGSQAPGADLKIRFTDSSKLKYEGDWSIISYQAYTSKSVGSGKRKGTMTCLPNLNGTFQIIAEYKSTENRGTHARYFVDGKLAKEVDQKGGTTAGHSSFPKVSLGVFSLKPDSTVELRCEDGKSYSFVSFTFTSSTATPADQGPVATSPDDDPEDESDDTGSSPDVLKAAKDGVMTVRPFLSTYKPATLRVLVDGVVVLDWSRTNSTRRELCVFSGKADPASMIERKAGDYSPAPGLEYTCALKAGQTVRLIKTGDYEPATFLKVEGPFGGTGSLNELLQEPPQDTEAGKAKKKD